MICKVCKKHRIDSIIAQSKKAMKRYTVKLREEKYARQKNNNKNEKL